LLLALCACETAEHRAWVARRGELDRRLAELNNLDAHRAELEADTATLVLEWENSKTSLDLAYFVRMSGIEEARVFAEPGLVRVQVVGTLAECRQAVAQLARTRWLLSRWRLRLEGGRCDWEGRSTPAFTELEQLLVLPKPKWVEPTPSMFSSDIDLERQRTQKLQLDIGALERRLGPLATLDAVREAAPKVKALRAKLEAEPTPCDLAILDRELAQDTPGALLEVSEQKLVHPLEPLGDARLRGTVEVTSTGLRWTCDAQ
jgi:hypothetical protein